MKKVLISILSIVIIIGFIFASCSSENNDIDKGQDHVIQKFISSETFSRFKIKIEEYGSISYNEIKTGVITVVDEQISILSVPIYKEGKKIGIVEVVDLKSTKYLPNGDAYALNFVDLTKFNSQTQTGYVEMIDLNYDSFKHSKIYVKDNKIINFESNKLPERLRVKYSKAKKAKRFKSPTNEYHPFDKDKDEDISFTECYSGMKETVESDPTNDFICDIPVAGWVSCWATITASCIIISAFN